MLLNLKPWLSTLAAQLELAGELLKAVLAWASSPEMLT